MYVGAESQLSTLGANTVLVSGNTLVNGGGAPSGTGQGAITIYNSTTYAVSNITVTGNQIVNPLNYPVQYVGTAAKKPASSRTMWSMTAIRPRA